MCIRDRLNNPRHLSSVAKRHFWDALSLIFQHFMFSLELSVITGDYYCMCCYLVNRVWFTTDFCTTSTNQNQKQYKNYKYNQLPTIRPNGKEIHDYAETILDPR